MKKTLLISSLFAQSIFAASLEKIKERGFIKAGVHFELAGMGYLNNGGKNQGFEIEIARSIAESIFGDRNKIEFIKTTGNERLTKIKTDKVDMVLANFTVNAQRTRIVDFADAYIKVNIGILSPSDAPIKNLSELNGQHLLVIKGSTTDRFISSKYKNSISLDKCDTYTDCWEKVEKGVAAFAHDNNALYAYAKTHKNFVVHLVGSDVADLIAPAVSKDNPELKELINTEISKLKSNGKLIEWFNTYLKPIYGDKVNPEDIINL